ncbi:hypothetical protein [Pontibacillus sp. HMF3514]|uniref:hypothetical protein n=1 Tax=Pontibacillus sp. HMF3514 TaxID=2692425 RepID=UPI00131FB6F8|nr:hypothetical protein [Pontibacillus sp. HMF3514]QHE51690.1 hypothetical protein GS400_06405 [Pontibacillus sp. HMF3514]
MPKVFAIIIPIFTIIITMSIVLLMQNNSNKAINHNKSLTLLGVGFLGIIILIVFYFGLK